MSQIVTQKQCTESKTGLGAQVHTQRTMAVRMVRLGCAHCVPAARAPRRVVARSGAVSQAHPVVSQRTPGRVAVHGWPCRCCAARPCAISQRLPRSCRVCIATQPTTKPLPPYHDTIDCIVTRLQPDCPLVKIQRLYRDTTPQWPAPRLCHDIARCITTQSTSHSSLRLSRYN